MKLFFILFIALFNHNSFAISDQDMVQTLRSYLDFGNYSGVDGNGDECLVNVYQGIVPKGKILPAKYYLEIRSKNKIEEYYFITNRIMGGRGDCSSIDLETSILLETHNRGKYAPCFSHENKSSSKGLGVYHSPLDQQSAISIFNYSYKEVASCIISI